MNYLSVCSGIESATVAWHGLGFKPIGFSEIEPFPCAVLAHHYPDVPNYGDMTKYKEWQINDPIELVVGGTPCQSFSVAGLRKGLDDPRGNLMLTYLGILDRFKPRWCIWENVPGVLSSNRGRDFGSFLGAVAKLGYGFSYRVLDAQFFGVPQRRRRVFVVGYLGDATRAAQVLFERGCVSGNSKTSRGTRKACTYRTENSTGRILPDISYSLTTSNQRWDHTAETYIGEVMAFQSNHSKSMDMPVSVEQAPTLTTNAKYMAVCFSPDRRDGIRVHGEQTPTLTAFMGTGGNNIPCITDNAYAIAENTIGRSLTSGGNGSGFSEETMYTLTTSNPHAVAYKRRVRRLMPIECERLQGFPDNYSLIPGARAAKIDDDVYTYLKQYFPDLTPEEAKRLAKDAPRYKALGNSMAVPVMRWIGQRIKQFN